MIGTNSCVLNGFDSHIIRIEGNYLHGYSGLSIIGQFHDVCRDGKERALAALEHLGVKQPSQRIVLSLYPADIKAEGSQADLAFAITLAQLFNEKYRQRNTNRFIFLAEISLDGQLKSTKGLLPLLLTAIREGYEHIVVDAESAEWLQFMNAELFLNCKIHKAKDLGQVLDWLAGYGDIPIIVFSENDSQPLDQQLPNFDDMLLSPDQQKLAMVIALGRHHCLLSGPPGCGKSMFAARIPSLLPPLKQEEHLQSMLIRSYRGTDLRDAIRCRNRPYRAPHHSATMQAMTGSNFGPGEFALAHSGLLFMDEIPEFRRDVLESLREPLESGMIHVSRAQLIQQWPASFILVAARNPCHCGYFGSNARRCRCTIRQVQTYQLRLSGPIMDRIDIHFDMPEPEQHDEFFKTFTKTRKGFSAQLRDQTAQAADRMQSRNLQFGLTYNGSITSQHIQAISGLNETRFNQLLQDTLNPQETSRGTLKILRVARSLADLEDEDCLSERHLQQAMAWHKSYDRNKAYGL